MEIAARPPDCLFPFPHFPLAVGVCLTYLLSLAPRSHCILHLSSTSSAASLSRRHFSPSPTMKHTYHILYFLHFSNLRIYSNTFRSFRICEQIKWRCYWASFGVDCLTDKFLLKLKKKPSLRCRVSSYSLDVLQGIFKQVFTVVKNLLITFWRVSEVGVGSWLVFCLGCFYDI